MQFYSGEYLNGLWIALLLVVFWWGVGRRRDRRWNQFGRPSTLLRIAPDHSHERWFWRGFLVVFVFCFFIIALARPQWGAEKRRIERKGVDIVFLLDTSLSMLTADVKPSRFERAKEEIRSFLKRLKGDRVGLVTFSGSGFLQSPLTLDYAAFLLFLEAVQVGHVPDPGSSLSQAIETAVRSFPEEGLKYRVAVVLSDGEVHGENLAPVLEKAKKENVRIYTLGLGRKEGEPIPLKTEGGRVVSYKKDRAGSIVISKLEEEVLIRIASDTGARYFPVTPGEREIDLIYQDIQKLGKKEFKAELVTEREEQYQVFLLLAFLLLVWEALMGERLKSKRREVVTL